MTNEDLIIQLKEEGRSQKYITNALLEKNGGFIGYMIKKYPNIPYEEAYSCILLGFVKASNKYEVESGTKFISFLFTCLTNELNQYLRRKRK